MDLEESLQDTDKRLNSANKLEGGFSPIEQVNEGATNESKGSEMDTSFQM